LGQVQVAFSDCSDSHPAHFFVRVRQCRKARVASRSAQQVARADRLEALRGVRRASSRSDVVPGSLAQPGNDRGERRLAHLRFRVAQRGSKSLGRRLGAELFERSSRRRTNLAVSIAERALEPATSFRWALGARLAQYHARRQPRVSRARIHVAQRGLERGTKRREAVGHRDGVRVT
jgi:hypothetical protein